MEVPPLPPPHKITVDEIPPLSLNLSDEIHEDMTDEQLVVAFRSLRKRLDDEKKYRRTTTFALVLVVFLVALAGIGLFLFNKTRLDDRVAQNRNGCNRGNELRQQIRDIGTKINARQDNFINILLTASALAGNDQKLTPEEKKQNDVAVKELRRLSDIDSKEVQEIIQKIEDNDCNSLYK